jgi:hypothetical protein
MSKRLRSLQVGEGGATLKGENSGATAPAAPLAVGELNPGGEIRITIRIMIKIMIKRIAAYTCKV